MEAPYEVGNMNYIFKIVNKIFKNPKSPPQNLTTDKHGNLLESADGVSKTWFEFLSNKFKGTVTEDDRPEMTDIPNSRGEYAPL